MLNKPVILPHIDGRHAVINELINRLFVFDLQELHQLLGGEKFVIRNNRSCCPGTPG